MGSHLLSSKNRKVSMAYKVVDPGQSFGNHTYEYWVEAWTRWFYRVNPDQSNNDVCIFLRCLPLSPNAGYRGEGLVMVGADTLVISQDQGVLVPVITANYIADHGEQTQWLYEMVRQHIFGGDHPPLKQQLRIDGEPLKDTEVGNDLSSYDIETGVFLVDIPDSSYGQSLKDMVEAPVQSSGFFPAVTRGYFVILKDFSEGDHYIECYARGMTTASGDYHSSMLYHIKVQPRSLRFVINQLTAPSKPVSNILATLDKKHLNGEITDGEYLNLTGIVKKSATEIADKIKDQREYLNLFRQVAEKIGKGNIDKATMEKLKSLL
jgi:hypothetical protein